MPEQRWETAVECSRALREALIGVLANPSAPLLKALAASCLVRDPELPEQRNGKGRIEWDPALRDTENVPLMEDVDEYFAREVLPHVPDADSADLEGKIGYQIPFTRFFYRYTPPRPSHEIKAELREREARIQHLARVPIVAGLNVAAQEGEPGWPRFIRTTDVVAPRALGPQVVRVPPSDVGGCEVLRRDLLFCRTGSPGTVYFHESGETAAFAGYLVRVRPDPTKVVPEFLAYWAESSPCRRQIMQGTIRSTVDNFNATKVANLVSPEMSALNQRKTVAFLDRECARLENLQIECARFESEAFAPALARFADLTKPWPRGRIGYRYSVQLGKMLDEKRIEADDVHPYLRNSNVQWDSLVLDDLKQMSFSPAERRKYELRPGDLLVCEGGQPGRSAIWDGSVPDCYFQKALMRVRPRAAESTRFLMWCLRLAHGCGDFAAEGTGSTILHLPAERLIATRISLPHADEQRAITREVDNLAARVSGVARETAHVRALLVEYRGALITEAVMGNLDVTSLSESQLGESAEAAMEGERPAVLSA